MIKNLSRKTCLLVVFMCSIWGMAHAQITLGAKTCINFSSFRANNRYDAVPGLNVGGFAKMQITNYLKLRVELLYNQQGANLIDYSVIAPDLFHATSTVKKAT